MSGSGNHRAMTAHPSIPALRRAVIRRGSNRPPASLSSDEPREAGHSAHFLMHDSNLRAYRLDRKEPTVEADRGNTGGGNMIRFGFSLKTRSGQRVENIMIMAPTQADAERRLRQMYLQCEILQCNAQA